MTKWSVAVLAVLALGIVASPEPVTVDVGASQWSAPRTPWGDPDLQGTWSNITATPFERPEDLAGQAELTAEETAAYEQKIADQRLAFEEVSHTGYSLEVWFERGNRLASNRTSAIVDPPDGRVPALTAEAERKAETGRAAREAHPADSWEDVSLFTRCLTRGMPGSMIPGFYNHNYQILQIPGYVVILLEMIHDVRIIPLDGRPHVAPEIGQWMGDARGRWEGRDAGRRDDQLRAAIGLHRGRLCQPAGQLPGVGGDAAADRALYAGRRRDDRLRVHRGGSDHLDGTVDGQPPDAARRSTRATV